MLLLHLLALSVHVAVGVRVPQDCLGDVVGAVHRGSLWYLTVFCLTLTLLYLMSLQNTLWETACCRWDMQPGSPWSALTNSVDQLRPTVFFRSQGGESGGGISCLHYRRVAGAWLSRVNGCRDIHAGIQDRILGFWHEVARLVWARKHGHWKRLRPSMSSDSLDSLVTKQQIMPHD